MTKSVQVSARTTYASTDLPEGWNWSKSKYVAEYTNGFAFKPSHWEDAGVPIIRIANLTDSEADINRTSIPVPARYRIEFGDILISWSATLSVKVWHGETAWLNQHIFRADPRTKLVDRDFFVWGAKWFVKELDEAAHGSTMQHVTWGKFGSAVFPLPPKEEQRTIAAFLDHETARIDRLIEKQERLIELLKEKRQAVISHAITKGLNPDVPMKDSGVEWLGEIPEHWDLPRLGYIGQCQNGLSIGGEFFGRGHPFVSYGDVYKNEVLPGKLEGLVESAAEQRVAYSVEYGDVFFTRTSETLDEIALSSVCLRSIPDATFAGFLIRFRPASRQLYPPFSRYLFRSDFSRAHFLGKMNIVTRASLGQGLLKKLRVPLPPIDEQKQIADFLDRQCSAFEGLIKNAGAMPGLLVERRSALISAAVTGRIDVRNRKSGPTEIF